MDTTQIRNLAFLMSLGGLSSACGDDEKSPLTTGTASAGTTNTTAGTTNTTNSTNGTGPATDGSATDSDGTGQQPTDGGTETSVGPLTTGTTDDGGTLTSVGPVTTGTTGFDTDTDTGEPPPAICTTYADKIVECYARAAPYHDDYAAYCGSLLDMGAAADGQACADALEAWMACLSSLDCAAFADPVMCQAQSDAIGTACPNL